jgi:ribosomal protein L11 methyltransferase
MGSVVAVGNPRSEGRARPTYSRLVVPRRAGDDALVGLLSLHGPLGFESAGRDLVAYFRGSLEARAAADGLRAARIRHELTTDIVEADPMEAYRARSRPFSVGRRLWIDPGDPPWSDPPEGRIALRLPASRAFGTGEHPSTRLALEVLEQEPLLGRSVLDVGTGSGILALAAAALGAGTVVALDTDPDAVFVARENRGRHGEGRRVRLFAGGISACAGRFDLVVANMLAEEILPEARALQARAERSGRVVLSGLTREREAPVLERMRSGRWKLAGRLTEGAWVCLSLSRAS